MPYKITIDDPKCIACGACCALSENFKMKDDNSLAVVVNEIVEDIDMNEEAAETCPTDCIKVEKID